MPRRPSRQPRKLPPSPVLQAVDWFASRRAGRRQTAGLSVRQRLELLLPLRDNQLEARRALQEHALTECRRKSIDPKAVCRIGERAMTDADLASARGAGLDSARRQADEAAFLRRFLADIPKFRRIAEAHLGAVLEAREFLDALKIVEREGPDLTAPFTMFFPKGGRYRRPRPGGQKRPWVQTAARGLKNLGLSQGARHELLQAWGFRPLDES